MRDLKRAEIELESSRVIQNICSIEIFEFESSKWPCSIELENFELRARKPCSKLDSKAISEPRSGPDRDRPILGPSRTEPRLNIPDLVSFSVCFAYFSLIYSGPEACLKLASRDYY